LSWYSQNLPCSLAAIAAIAAGRANAWKGMGWFFQATFTLFPYCCSICLIVGSTRLQYGHWKSDHSTMVIGALFGPLTGAAPTATSWAAGGAVGAAASAISRS